MNDKVIAFIDKAREALNAACRRGRIRMCVPVQDDDDDILISRALDEARALLSSAPPAPAPDEDGEARKLTTRWIELWRLDRVLPSEPCESLDGLIAAALSRAKAAQREEDAKHRQLICELLSKAQRKLVDWAPPDAVGWVSKFLDEVDAALRSRDGAQ